MKKLFILLFVFTITSSFLFSGSISITYPIAGSDIKIGSRVSIKWIARGISKSLKISLWRNRVFKKVIHANINGRKLRGSYSWTVNSPEGTGYHIKIQENGTKVSARSNGTFKIMHAGILFDGDIDIQPLDPAKFLPDFDVIDTFLTSEGRLVTKIMNLGKDFRGELFFECVIGSRKFTIKKPAFSIKKNQVKEVFTGGIVTQNDINYPNPKVLLGIRVDPHKKIKEVNENNNLQSLMYKHNICPDLTMKVIWVTRPNPSTRDFILSGKVLNIGNADSPKCKAYIKVLDSQQKRLSIHHFDIKSLKPGKFTTFSITRENMHFGTYTFVIMADSEKKVVECTENNATSKTFTVR